MNDSVLECLKTAIDAVNFGSSDYSRLNLYESLNNCEEFMETLEAESEKSYSGLLNDYKDLAEEVFRIKLMYSLRKVTEEYGENIDKVRVRSNLFGRFDIYPGKESEVDFAKRIKDVMLMLMKGLPDYDQYDKPRSWWKISIHCTHGVDGDSLSSDEYKYVFSF